MLANGLIKSNRVAAVGLASVPPGLWLTQAGNEEGRQKELLSGQEVRLR